MQLALMAGGWVGGCGGLRSGSEQPSEAVWLLARCQGLAARLHVGTVAQHVETSLSWRLTGVGGCRAGSPPQRNAARRCKFRSKPWRPPCAPSTLADTRACSRDRQQLQEAAGNAERGGL